MSYKTTFFAIATAAIVALPLTSFADISVVAGTDSSSAASPAVSGGASSAGSSAPAAGGSTSSAGASAPSVGGSTSSADAGSTSNGGSNSSTGFVNNPTGGASFYGGGYAPVSSTTSSYSTSTAVSSSTISCPLISSYMRLGMASNNSADVAKLQAFLKDSEHLDVAVTGTFDAETEAAVKAFQNTYLGDIMGPWSATKASGIVYITTLKKINQLACSQPLTLSASDLAIINAYKANASASTHVQAPAGVQASGTSPVIGSAPIVGPIANTAAAANASMMSKFVAFIKNLF